MSNQYIPPKVWSYNAENGGQWASTNRPVSGATHEKSLPIGKHALQLYSMGTPNGQKITIMLEELLALGKNAQYDAHLINIREGDQFSSGFVDINPNSKIPALVDLSSDDRAPIFESGSILFYLAEKFGAFLPASGQARAECMSWVMWQMGAGPFLGGGFGHFYAYAPEKLKYPIDRYTMEVKRQLDLLDKHLADNEYFVGSEYTIADMAIWPWYGVLVLGKLYEAAEFLQVDEYTHVKRWAETINARKAVKRGRLVNKVWGNEEYQLKDRHSMLDFPENLR